MEFYTLDSLLRRENIFDRFESLIWTERFSSFGDFQLVIPSTPETRSLLVAGVRTVVNTSKRVGEITTVLDTNDAEGRAVLKVYGKDLVKVLGDRVATNSTTSNAPWVITDLPADVMRYMFDQICRLGVPVTEDILPFLVSGTVYPASGIAEPSASITWSQDKDTLYNAIKKLADIYNLGFRLVRDGDDSKLYFDVYSGTDRRTIGWPWPTSAPVVFSRELDNLQNTTQLKTIDGMKNVAYVFSAAGSRVVYGLDVDPTVDGFERRVLVVNSNVAAGTAGWEALLDLEGAEELSKHRSLQAFDGEISQNSNYVYERDYYLGDLVEMRNTDGTTSSVRVTEQIFVEDQEGERAYPTLSASSAGNPDA